MTVHGAGKPDTRRLRHLRRLSENQALAAGRRDQGGCHDVIGGELERGGDPQHLVGRPSAGRMDGTSRARPSVSVPVLSITMVRTRASASSAFPPLTSTPCLAVPRHAGDDRHRHRQDERTGRSHHQHGERPNRIAGRKPRRASEQDGRRQEPKRVTVGQSRHRRLWRAAPLPPAARYRRKCFPTTAASPPDRTPCPYWSSR